MYWSTANQKEASSDVHARAWAAVGAVTFATGKVVVTEEKHGLVLSRTRQGDKEYFYNVADDNERAWK
jgi:hypothetical protein